MKYRLLLCLLPVAALAAGCVKEEEPQVASHLTTKNSESLVVTEGPACIEGTVLVRMKPSVANDMVASHHKMKSVLEPFEAKGVVSMERVFEDAGEFEARHREAGLHEWYRARFDASRPVAEMLEELRALPGVESVEVERRKKLLGTSFFNDTYYSKQWALHNDGTKSANHTAGVDINVEPVWKDYTAGTSDVIVAVVDGGIDLTHEDLAAICIPGGKNGSKNFVNNTFVIAAHSHGTHVGGTIGAISNNGKGVAGVAGGKDGKGGVRLMSCQIFMTQENGKDKGGDSEAAIIWGADHGAVICQNSWGYVYDKESDALKGGSGAAGSAIQYFNKYAGLDAEGKQVGPMAGGVVIFAAGNDNFAKGWPAADPNCIAVGAIGPNGYRSSYSNYGDWVDICAPGGESQYDEIYNTYPGSKYGNMQGTSMACPHVSGVAALIVSHYGGQGFTREMLIDKLLNGVNTKYPLNSKSKPIGNLVDAYGAFSQGGNTPPDKVESFAVTPRSNNLDFEWKVTADSDNDKAYGYLLLAAKTSSELSGLNYRQIPSTVKSVVVNVGQLAKNAKITGSISGLDFESKYFAAVVGFDYGKNYSALSDVKEVTTLKNNPPVIATDYKGDFKIKSHETFKIKYSITEPDSHSFKVAYTQGSPADTLYTVNDGYEFTVLAKNAEPGSYKAVIKATDQYDLAASDTIGYTILENHAPVMSRTLENLVFETKGKLTVINMNEYITDPDGERIQYEISFSPKGVVQCVQNDTTLRITTLSYGAATVNVIARDCRTQTPLSFKVLVRDPAAGVDSYPNPVVDTLNISAGVMSDFDITMANSAGAVVLETSQRGSAFDPVRIDMSAFAPGRYGVRIVHEGKVYDKTIIKL